MKRGILIVYCGFAVAALVTAPPSAADGCPYGTVPTRFPGVCTQGQAGSAAPPAIIVPPQGAAPAVAPGSDFATIDGIPCNPQHQGTCIGLSMSQP